MGTTYRITQAGRAAAAAGPDPLGSRYLHDLLDLLESSEAGIRDRELRQFMPPASLEASILALLERGLIERGEPLCPRAGIPPPWQPRAISVPRV